LRWLHLMQVRPLEQIYTSCSHDLKLHRWFFGSTRLLLSFTSVGAFLGLSEMPEKVCSLSFSFFMLSLWRFLWSLFWSAFFSDGWNLVTPQYANSLHFPLQVWGVVLFVPSISSYTLYLWHIEHLCGPLVCLTGSSSISWSESIVPHSILLERKQKKPTTPNKIFLGSFYTTLKWPMNLTHMWMAIQLYNTSINIKVYANNSI